MNFESPFHQPPALLWHLFWTGMFSIQLFAVIHYWRFRWLRWKKDHDEWKSAEFLPPTKSPDYWGYHAGPEDGGHAS